MCKIWNLSARTNVHVLGTVLVLTETQASVIAERLPTIGGSSPDTKNALVRVVSGGIQQHHAVITDRFTSAQVMKFLSDALGSKEIFSDMVICSTDKEAIKSLRSALCGTSNVSANVFCVGAGKEFIGSEANYFVESL